MGKSISLATLVFAREPGKGTAKSRIAATHGREQADTIYRELLEVMATEFADIDLHVAYTDSRQPMELRQLFVEATSFLPQKGADLGERLYNACDTLFEAGYNAVCAVGVDCPDLTVEDVIAVQQELEQGADIVVGPAADGGYYLIACTPESIDIFDVDSWGSDRLMEDTLALAAKSGWTLHQLAVKKDIDTFDDYAQWKREEE